MRKNQKTIAVLTALSTMIATTGCSEEQIRQEYEAEKEKVYEDMDAKLEQQKEEIVNSILAELQGTTDPVVTTTYDAQATSLTTAATTLKQTTPVTTENEQPVTRVTPEPRLTIPTKYTTATTASTTTTAVVEEQSNEKSYKINNQPEMHEKSSGYYVTNEYTIQPVKECQGKMGEYLYSVVTKLYGSYNENSDVVKKIKELNNLTSNFIPVKGGNDKGTIILPGKVVYYRANSALAAQTETEFSMNEIKRLNGVEDETKTLETMYMLVKVLSANENTFNTNKGTAHVCGPTVIFAEDYIKCGKTYEDGFVDSALIKNPDNANQCYFIQVKPNGSYCEYLVAENANGIGTVDNIPYITITNKTTLYPVEFTNEAYTYAMNEEGALYALENLSAYFNFPIKHTIDLRTGYQKTK